jgi:hypothetical protein
MLAMENTHSANHAQLTGTRLTPMRQMFAIEAANSPERHQFGNRRKFSRGLGSAQPGYDTAWTKRVAVA